MMLRCVSAFLFLVLQVPNEVIGAVEVSFKLKHYSNENHEQLSGGCCDPVFALCFACDNSFEVCFGKVQSSFTVDDCPYGKYSTDELSNDDDDDDFYFPSILPGAGPNPIVFVVNPWEDGFRANIAVRDEDPFPYNGDDVDNIGYNFQGSTYQPSRSSTLATPIPKTLNHGPGEAVITVEVKVYCQVHYYGTSSGCSTYCVARDDRLGHYDCDDFTGEKICHDGWEGTTCNQPTNECTSNPCLNGGTCQDRHKGYICICQPGTTGLQCQNDIDECLSSPCVYGVCDTPPGTFNAYICDCQPGYEGMNCDHEVDECATNPCESGEICFDLLDAFLCSLAESRYVGCYDLIAVGCHNEACEYGLHVSQNMSVSSCISWCRSFQGRYTYAWLHLGNSCRCENEASIDHSNRVPDMTCNSPCSGRKDEHCGGLRHIALFNLSSENGETETPASQGMPGGQVGLIFIAVTVFLYAAVITILHIRFRRMFGQSQTDGNGQDLYMQANPETGQTCHEMASAGTAFPGSPSLFPEKQAERPYYSGILNRVAKFETRNEGANNKHQ